ncbi:hypothetical protein HPB49_003834 [Dermacentor silvarum]|uniref:Uncharacterized protein n=1 Tax=Dermacentor silvarum TaxID=543639 RepID=A0ACB8D2P9_DERSI|nr:hypothetical protein HPB49_003834 [Dermacentor silvarum]
MESTGASDPAASQAVSAFSFRLPNFWPADPSVWLAQVNSQFVTARITSKTSIFHHVVSALPPEIAAEIRDLILTPPETNPYDGLHCGGPHAATEPRCPQWQLERRVAATLANSKPRITRKQALELVRGSGATAAPSPKQHPVTQRATKRGPPSSRLQPGLSYSAALTGGTQAGSSSSTRGDSGEPPATDDNPAQPPGASPPATTELVVTALASALRSLLELVPADSPARHMCVAALAMHDALVQHG